VGKSKGDIMLDLLDFVSAGINMINIVILLFLLYVFTKNYRHIKSKYNIGLIIFSLVFLIENVIILHLGIFEWPSVIENIVLLHMITVDFIELLGLLTLLYITWK
jgi:hypothetical protein